MIIHPTQWDYLFGVSHVLTEQAKAKGRGMIQVDIPFQAHVWWHHGYLLRGSTEYRSAEEALVDVRAALSQVMELPPPTAG